MPSYAHYCYLLTSGDYGTWHVDEFTPDPGTYTEKWGVNLTQARDIAQGGEVRVVDGDLVVIPAPVPNDGTP